MLQLNWVPLLPFVFLFLTRAFSFSLQSSRFSDIFTRSWMIVLFCFIIVEVAVVFASEGLANPTAGSSMDSVARITSR